MSKLHQLLMVSRCFPPQGGVGVERVSKYAKYLPDFGWVPTVLTGRQGCYGWPEDPFLAEEVKDVATIRSYAPDLFAWFAKMKQNVSSGRPTQVQKRGYASRGQWHPKSLLIPDSQALWIPIAWASALRQSKRYTWDVVYGTTGPATNLVVAYLIAKSLNLPLILDYRDPWTGYFLSPRRLAPLAALEAKLEAKIFSSAGGVTALNPVCIETPIRRTSDLPPFEIIPNGYDEADFVGRSPKALPHFSIVHTGSLHARRPLTDIWRILQITLGSTPQLEGKIHFWQIGTVDDVVAQQLNTAPDGVEVHYVPPVPMKEAIDYMLGADLLYASSPAYGSLNSPAKIYQYMRANRPILAIHEEGAETFRAEINDANISLACLRGAHATAAEFLTERALDENHSPPPIGPRITQYSRRELTGRFADFITTKVLEI